MTLEGRIVGVRMSKPTKVGYAFQPERILSIESEDKSLLEKLNKGEKHYSILRFSQPIACDARFPDAFSLGYCLMERKEHIRIECRTPDLNEIEYANDDIVVDSLSVGMGFEQPKKECKQSNTEGNKTSTAQPNQGGK